MADSATPRGNRAGKSAAEAREELDQLEAEMAVSDLARHMVRGIGGEHDFYARQIRRWAQLGLLRVDSIKGSGRRAARLFHPDTVFSARLLSFLTQIGMTNDDMEVFINAFARPDEDGLVPLDYIKQQRPTFLVGYYDDDGVVSDARWYLTPTNEGELHEHVAALRIDLRQMLSPLLDSRST